MSRMRFHKIAGVLMGHREPDPPHIPRELFMAGRGAILGLFPGDIGSIRGARHAVLGIDPGGVGLNAASRHAIIRGGLLDNSQISQARGVVTLAGMPIDGEPMDTADFRDVVVGAILPTGIATPLPDAFTLPVGRWKRDVQLRARFGAAAGEFNKPIPMSIPTYGPATIDGTGATFIESAPRVCGRTLVVATWRNGNTVGGGDPIVTVGAPGRVEGTGTLVPLIRRTGDQWGITSISVHLLQLATEGEYTAQAAWPTIEPVIGVGIAVFEVSAAGEDYSGTNTVVSSSGSGTINLAHAAQPGDKLLRFACMDGTGVGGPSPTDDLIMSARVGRTGFAANFTEATESRSYPFVGNGGATPSNARSGISLRLRP